MDKQTDLLDWFLSEVKQAGSLEKFEQQQADTNPNYYVAKETNTLVTGDRQQMYSPFQEKQKQA
ncbi:MAG: hypothetical protein ACRCXZ_04770 [Patescibacteria group bacterium]